MKNFVTLASIGLMILLSSMSYSQEKSYTLNKSDNIANELVIDLFFNDVSQAERSAIITKFSGLSNTKSIALNDSGSVHLIADDKRIIGIIEGILSERNIQKQQ